MLSNATAIAAATTATTKVALQWLPHDATATTTTTSTLHTFTTTADAAVTAAQLLTSTASRMLYNNNNYNSSHANDELSTVSTSAASDVATAEAADLINNDIVQIFFCILYTTVFVLGVFGNVLVCYVVLRNRAMQTVTNIFITNLALSDILLCVLAVPFTPLYTFMGRWAFGRTLCHLVSFAQGCSIYISTLTLTSIAVDRYFVIIYPFHPRMRLRTCILIIVSIWVFSLLATVPYGMYMKVVLANDTTNELDLNATALPQATQTPAPSSAAAYLQVLTAAGGTATVAASSADESDGYLPGTTYCEENWPSEHYRKVFGSVTSILQFVLPFVIISICYIWVSFKLNARARAKPGSKSSRREEADRDRKKRTNRMLISMVAVFGLSWLPINVVNIFDDFYEKSNEWRFYTLFFFVAHSVAMSSTCYNPFLYAWLNENFRKEFKHVLPCFNPSNNNIINITRGYNRSERNTCGPRLRNGGGEGACGAGGASTDFDDLDDNGVTQQSSLPKEQLLIIPREATYGNGAGAALTPTLLHAQHRVDMLLSDTTRCQVSDNDIDSVDEEQTVEMRFVETPFVSSENATGVSITMETSASNEAERSSNCSDRERDRGRRSN